jgi:antitoxin (DNA-binding transcriptional repressor) of toxin-antitoxin stability system
MAQKGDRRRGKPLNPDLGYAGDPVHHATSGLPPQRIGIRELRQHASVYVDLVERGYTIDITNRGRLVAQMVPVRDPESPLERWIARGVIERAEDDGSVLDVDPYPAGLTDDAGRAGQAGDGDRTGSYSRPSASQALAELRAAEEAGQP